MEATKNNLKEVPEVSLISTSAFKSHRIPLTALGERYIFYSAQPIWDYVDGKKTDKQLGLKYKVMSTMPEYRGHFFYIKVLNGSAENVVTAGGYNPANDIIVSFNSAYFYFYVDFKNKSRLEMVAIANDVEVVDEKVRF